MNVLKSVTKEYQKGKKKKSVKKFSILKYVIKGYKKKKKITLIIGKCQYNLVICKDKKGQIFLIFAVEYL